MLLSYPRCLSHLVLFPRRSCGTDNLWLDIDKSASDVDGRGTRTHALRNMVFILGCRGERILSPLSPLFPSHCKQIYQSPTMNYVFCPALQRCGLNGREILNVRRAGAMKWTMRQGFGHLLKVLWTVCSSGHSALKMVTSLLLFFILSDKEKRISRTLYLLSGQRTWLSLYLPLADLEGKKSAVPQRSGV